MLEILQILALTILVSFLIYEETTRNDSKRDAAVQMCIFGFPVGLVIVGLYFPLRHFQIKLIENIPLLILSLVFFLIFLIVCKTTEPK